MRYKITKSKHNQEIIRTDIWRLSPDALVQKSILLRVAEYRKFLLPIVILVNSQWVNLASLTTTEQVNQVEKMMHRTAKNQLKHHYYTTAVVKNPKSLFLRTYLDGKPKMVRKVQSKSKVFIYSVIVKLLAW